MCVVLWMNPGSLYAKLYSATEPHSRPLCRIPFPVREPTAKDDVDFYQSLKELGARQIPNRQTREEPQTDKDKNLQLFYPQEARERPGRLFLPPAGHPLRPNSTGRQEDTFKVILNMFT